VSSKSDLRIVFLGNPEFARFHLDRIIAEGYHVVAVVSAPDKPAGRGLKTLATPVTLFAREKEIPCLQPSNLKNEHFLQELATYKANIQIVIAFRMLPEVVWDMPSLGTINLHASLLPQYRGAAPINWAIINGEKVTGVSTFKLKHEIDTGNLLVQKECIITSHDTAGTLHDKLMHLGADAVVETLEQIATGNYTEIEQDQSKALHYAPKLNSENTQINSQASGKSILQLIKGLNPYPVAYTQFDGKNMKVYNATFEQQNHSKTAGTYISDGKSLLGLYVADGIVWLLDIKIEGKRQMKVRDFLNGYDISRLQIERV
jgi:methionyl-tRNA formyltransferase